MLFSLTKLAMLAPLDSNLDNISFVESAAVEARRLLFVLLSDAQSSPFLDVIRFSRANKEQLVAHLSQLSKAVHTLLLDRGANPSIKVLLRTCLDCTPQLVPYIFRGLHLSDPKPNYRTLSSLTLVDGVVRDAPSTQKVVCSDHGGQITCGTISREQLSLDKVLPAIIPNCVSKVLLGKIVQSTSALLVSSGLKLIVTLLHRAGEFVSALMEGSKEGCDEFKESICQAILNHLPQIPLLLSIPARFDPFVEKSSSANAIVVMELFKTLEAYWQLDPSHFAKLQFDWAKVVPIGIQVDSDDISRHFFNAEPLLQSTILRALADVSRLDSSPSSKLLSRVMSILTTTNVPEVYAAARDLALLLVKKELFGPRDSNLMQDDEETVSCNKYESSLWIDGICSNTIKDLILGIEELHQHRVNHKIFASQAWSSSEIPGRMPPLRVSLLLSFLISQLLRNEVEMSTEFSMLLVRIATKLLIYQSDPRPLASVIAFASAKKSHSITQIARLSQFAIAILQKDATTMSCLMSLQSAAFDSDTACISVSTASTLPYSHRLSSSTSLRECLSLMKYQGSKNPSGLSLLLRKILACSFEVR